MQGRLNAGHLIAAVGALALFVALFLDWYEAGPSGGVSAWTVFELVDLLLALIAVATLLAALEGVARGSRASIDADRWLPGLGAAALVLVVVSIVNNPPAVPRSGEEVGAWIALAGAALMLAGALASQRRISVVISSSPRSHPPAPSHEPTGPATDPPGSETATQPVHPVDTPPSR